MKLYYKAVEQANLCLALPGCRRIIPDRFIQGAMNTILGEGMSSRLFLEIREKHALAYDVHSFLNRFRDTGSTVVFAGVDPKRTGQTIQAILDEVQRLREVPVPEGEITKAKEFAKGRLLLGLEDSRSVAGWLGGQELSTGRILTVDDVVANIEKVTAGGHPARSAGALHAGEAEPGHRRSLQEGDPVRQAAEAVGPITN